MNEPRFFMFWLYNLELHNLDMSGMASTEPNPLSEFRTNNLKNSTFDYQKLAEKPTVDDLVTDFETINIGKDPCFQCDQCPAGYNSAGQLTKHVNSKHGNLTNQPTSKCEECGRVLSSMKALTKHIKVVHRTCSICKIEFESDSMKTKHMETDHLKQTFCEECYKDFKFESKLKRHNQQKHLKIPPI